MATGGRAEAVRVPPLATRRPTVPVEVLAARTLSLATLGPRGRAARRAQAHAELEALAGASLLELRRTLPGRYWILAMLALTGKSVREIAAMVGYAGPAPVLKALRHPAVVRLVEEVRAAQLEAITSGTYGVMAAAKAAAPAIAEHVAELAGGRKDQATGARVGRATRDSDAIRAADLVLTLSGDKIERQASLHLELLDGLTDSELELFSTRGAWPERLAGVGGLHEPPAGPALFTAGSGPPAGPVNAPLHRDRQTAPPARTRTGR
jgi:hypothetical protein